MRHKIKSSGYQQQYFPMVRIMNTPNPQSKDLNADRQQSQEQGDYAGPFYHSSIWIRHLDLATLDMTVNTFMNHITFLPNIECGNERQVHHVSFFAKKVKWWDLAQLDLDQIFHPIHNSSGMYMNIIVLLREDWSVARNLSGHVWHFPSGFLMKEMNT